MSEYVDTDMTVEAKLKDMIFTIGEKISVRRFAVVEGTTSTYIHGMGSIGVIVSFDTDCADNEGFAEFAKNIALQAGAYATPYLDRDHVPASVINEEKEVIMGQIKNDPKNAKKPENIIEKMAVGKLGKFFNRNIELHILAIKLYCVFKNSSCR